MKYFNFRRKNSLFPLLFSLFINTSYANTNPTYGWMSINGSSISDENIDTSLLSGSYKVCVKDALTSGQYNSCLDQEGDDIVENIHKMLDVMDNSLILKDKERNAALRKATITNINRINYLCDVFLINEKREKQPDNFMPYSDVATCRTWRLYLLSKLVSEIMQ
ncbi:hypothetical protein AH580_19070 [Salmonella enterica subsp. enterica serovar Montevideo]|nr:hypothetical protein [Salmonella enterica subsp. enterica serovar Newport]EDE7749258.1 hypothetical protein [Salmonella enterica subsp. enterica serovar Montevideo]EEC0576200.1 hypothetical protein [Salmonella enterica]EEK7290039.1 hypothetical protein [Salmonella enterica subsp. enterica serovar Montevideo]